MNGTLQFAVGLAVMGGGVALVGAAVLNDFVGYRPPGLRHAPVFLGFLGTALVLTGAVLGAD